MSLSVAVWSNCQWLICLEFSLKISFGTLAFPVVLKKSDATQQLPFTCYRICIDFGLLWCYFHLLRLNIYVGLYKYLPCWNFFFFVLSYNLELTMTWLINLYKIAHNDLSSCFGVMGYFVEGHDTFSSIRSISALGCNTTKQVNIKRKNTLDTQQPLY